MNPNDSNWEYLFNGKNLDGWEIKIRNHELGYNYNNTFKVKDGSLKVSYENYENFDDKFGHIFYTTKKFKNYRLSLGRIQCYSIRGKVTTWRKGKYL